MKDLKGLKIHCDTQEEKKELLEEATKQGFVWWYSKNKPTENPLLSQDNNYVFYENKTMCCGGINCISYKEYKAMSEFTKADLKPCMVVEFRNGEKAVVGMNNSGICFDYQDGISGTYAEECNEDLTSRIGENLDIMVVFGYCPYASGNSKNNTSLRPILWERKEEPQAVKETELIWQNVARVIQVQKNGFKKCVYEVPFENNKKETCETVLKNYLNIHHDKNSYFVTTDRICKVKE